MLSLEVKIFINIQLDVICADMVGFHRLGYIFYNPKSLESKLANRLRSFAKILPLQYFPTYSITLLSPFYKLSVQVLIKHHTNNHWWTSFSLMDFLFSLTN